MAGGFLSTEKFAVANTVLSSIFEGNSVNNDNFKQPVVWPGTIVTDDQTAELEAFILAELGSRAKYIGCFYTLPGDGGNGSRADAIFYVHSEDLNKFAVRRFQFGMRWVEDVLDNEARRIADGEQLSTIYVPEVHALYSWKRDEHREDGSETGCVGE